MRAISCVVVAAATAAGVGQISTGDIVLGHTDGPRESFSSQPTAGLLIGSVFDGRVPIRGIDGATLRGFAEDEYLALDWPGMPPIQDATFGGPNNFGAMQRIDGQPAAIAFDFSRVGGVLGFAGGAHDAGPGDTTFEFYDLAGNLMQTDTASYGNGGGFMSDFAFMTEPRGVYYRIDNPQGSQGSGTGSGEGFAADDFFVTSDVEMRGFTMTLISEFDLTEPPESVDVYWSLWEVDDEVFNERFVASASGVAVTVTPRNFRDNATSGLARDVYDVFIPVDPVLLTPGQYILATSRVTPNGNGEAFWATDVMAVEGRRPYIDAEGDLRAEGLPSTVPENVQAGVGNLVFTILTDEECTPAIGEIVVRGPRTAFDGLVFEPAASLQEAGFANTNFESFETFGNATLIGSIFGGTVPTSGDFGLRATTSGSDTRSSPASTVNPTSGVRLAQFSTAFNSGNPLTRSLNFANIGGINGFSGFASDVTFTPTTITFFDQNDDAIDTVIRSFGGGGSMEAFSFVSDTRIDRIEIVGDGTVFDDIAYKQDSTIRVGRITPDNVETFDTWPNQFDLPTIFAGDAIVTGTTALSTRSRGQWRDFRNGSTDDVRPFSGDQFGVLEDFANDFVTLDFTAIGGIEGFSGSATAVRDGDRTDIIFSDLNGDPID
ncbi:MAG: hypothetical protein AAF747_03385, partial [Planctomycetota bacterium]